MTEHFKNCPKCGKIQYYKQRCKLLSSIRKNTFCYSCSARSRDTNSYKDRWNTRRKNGTDHWKLSEHAINNIKIGAMRRVLRDGQSESIGKNEKQILDLEEKKIGNHIYRQYYIYQLGRKVDGYDPFLNIVYEVYEKQHKSHVEYDLKRQKDIEECLGCKFVIINDY